MSGGIYCVHPNGRKLPSPQPEGQGHDMSLIHIWSAATGGEKGGGHASSLTSGKTNAHDADRGKGYGIIADQTSGAPQIGGTAGF